MKPSSKTEFGIEAIKLHLDGSNILIKVLLYLFIMMSVSFIGPTQLQPLRPDQADKLWQEGCGCRQGHNFEARDLTFVRRPSYFQGIQSYVEYWEGEIWAKSNIGKN